MISARDFLLKLRFRSYAIPLLMRDLVLNVVYTVRPFPAMCSLRYGKKKTPNVPVMLQHKPCLPGYFAVFVLIPSRPLCSSERV